VGDRYAFGYCHQAFSSDTSKAQAILDSLTLLTSLRPRSSSEDSPVVIPPPSVLHKLHRTLVVEPSLAWSGTLPPGRTTALRDDSTVKIQAGTATPLLVTNASAITTPIPLPATTNFNNYAYPYGSQQSYRPQASSYTPYKTPQANYYPNYTSQQQPGYFAQTYATPTANQQPYGAATGQQPYAAYSWYGQYASTFQNNAGSGRGTPQPTLPQQTANLLANYSSFFNTATATPGSAAGGARTPAVGNTAAATSAAGVAIYNPAGGMAPTLPPQLKNNSTQNGATYHAQMQPAT
jgi:hypothetical protein